ncbi:MAG: RNA recognition motif domain-containing protein, partial [Gammaproteobacteria bacterium]
MKKVFVGSLPPDATEDEIRALFAQHGKVFSISLARDIFKG